MNISPDNWRRVQSPGWVAGVEAAQLRRWRPHRWRATTLQAHSNIFDQTSKSKNEKRLDDILSRVSGGRSKSLRMRCWLPRPFTSCSLEPLVLSSPCWPSTSRCFSQTFSTRQSLKSDPPGVGHGRCSMRVFDRSSAHHWVPRHAILAWYLWQVPFQSHWKIYKYKYTNINANGISWQVSVFTHFSFIHSFIDAFIHALLLVRFQAGKVLMLLAITSWVAFTLPIGFIHPPVVRYFSLGNQIFSFA